jgi:AraC-like DNA-binding protein
VNYREYPVPEALGRHVACFWRLTDEAPSGDTQTIYPDGHCELMVHLAAPPDCWDTRQGWHHQAPDSFAAQRLSAVRLRGIGRIDCLGLRLKPEASAVLGTDILQGAREQIVDLAAIDADFSRSFRAATQAFLAGREAGLWDFVAARITCLNIDEAIAQVVAEIRAHGGALRIGSLARGVGLSERSLQTRFLRAVGLTPKEFARLMRLQATLRALEGTTSLTELAADRGFADQAHASRELRRVTGLAPAKLRRALRDDRGGDVAIRLAAAFVRGHT